MMEDSQYASLMQDALAKIKDLRAKLEAVEKAKHEPIAVIGMSCRFPGASSPEAFWQLLQDGQEAITEVPANRWDINTYYNPDPQVPGKINAKEGGFLESVEMFDASFFNISPREAASLDPQQRLLLEVSWEALERANQTPNQLFASATGVFVGISTFDYALRLLNAKENIDAFVGTGSVLAPAAGRLSYWLGLTGPSMAVDTACSSSLVAAHLACQSLRQKECNLALVGGVNLLLDPALTINFAKAQMLSPDSRCKTFDAAADGYVRSEGCGVILLKRLSDAIAAQDNILALIRGAAVNQDGASGGFTIPSGPSQEAVIRQALENAQVTPEQINYIEAHGTGTSLGDPIEVIALDSVFGKERAEPLWIGSVKTNIGHLEAAAGIAGLIKVVLSLQHSQIPKHLHFNQPNPQIPWPSLSIKVANQPTPLPKDNAMAGLSSFGFSGTNAHLVLGAASQTPDNQAAVQPQRPLHLLTLSAKSDEALQALAQRYETYLNGQEATLSDICYTASTGRAHFKHRLAILAASTHEAQKQLGTFIQGQNSTGLWQGITDQTPRKIVFLFTGQGSQYVNMGRELYETQPTFRKTLERCNDILRPYLEQPLLSVLYPPDSDSHLTINETAYTQPALFSLEYALAELWKSWGITPDIVMGHSVGEYVAACLAGVFSLEDGLKLIAIRGRLIQNLPPNGAMVTIWANEAQVQEIIAADPEQISIAAINGLENVVISGTQQAIQQVIPIFKAQQIEAKELTVSHAFHSPLVEPILADFAQVANEVQFSVPQISLISNMTGKLVTSEVTLPSYWVNHIRQPVRFLTGMETLHTLNGQTFIEIGPKPALLALGQHCLPGDYETDNMLQWLPSLKSGISDWQQMLTSLSQLYVSGREIDWAGFDHDYSHQRVVLPTYPFQRQRYWTEPTVHQPKASTETELDPLLGKRLYSPLFQAICFESQISLARTPFIKDHQVLNEILVPAGAYVNMALTAAKTIFDTERVALEDFIIQSPFILTEEDEETVQLIVRDVTQTQASFEIVSLVPSNEGGMKDRDWQTHANGVMRPNNGNQSPPPIMDEIRAACPENIVASSFYAHLRAIGYHFGPAHQGIKNIWRGHNQALAEIQLPEQLVTDLPNYSFHPSLLDACSQVILSLLPETLPEQIFISIGKDWVELYDTPTPHLWVHVQKQTEQSDDSIFKGIFDIYADDGRKIMGIQGYLMKLTDRKVLIDNLRASKRRDIRNLLYEIEWQESKVSKPFVPAMLAKSLWLFFTGQTDVADQLEQFLSGNGVTCIKVLPGQRFEQLEPQVYTIDPFSPDQFLKLLEEVNKLKSELGVNFRGVMHLWSFTEGQVNPPTPDELDYQQALAVGSVLHLVQALATTTLHARFQLFLMTQGVQPVSNSIKAENPVQSMLWGLSRVIELEHPNLHVCCVELEPSNALGTVQTLCRHIFIDAEPLMVLRDKQRFVPRLVTAQLETPKQKKENALGQSTVLITGGLGGIGLELAQWLVSKGNIALALVARSQPSSQVEQKIQIWRDSGLSIRLFQADVTQYNALSNVLTTIQAEMPPLRGIIHAAGITDDKIKMLVNMEWEQFTKVLGPKVQGTWNLHLLTQALSLDFFILFSSITTIFGTVGLGNYSAANAFMDGLAYYRQSRGLPALSINWGPWADVGILARNELARKQWTERGMSPIPAEQGLQILDALFKHVGTQYAAFKINWELWLKHYPGKGIPPLVAEWVKPAKQREASKPQAQIKQSANILQKLQLAPPKQRATVLTTYVCEELASVLGHISIEAIDTQITFTQMGIESLMAMELTNRLQSSLNCRLPSSLVFQYPTVEKLVNYLMTEVLKADETELSEKEEERDVIEL